MAKLKERQFYNVGKGKNETVPEEFIDIVKFKNGAHALRGISRDNITMLKLISESNLYKLQAKYGKAKKYKRK